MVITGNSKGQQGKVLKVDTAKSKAIVEGINMVSKHTKPNAKSLRVVSLKRKPWFMFPI